MKRYAIDLDLSKCISCSACAVACMDQNDFEAEKGHPPFRNVFDMERREDQGTAYSHLSLACMHCEDAPCITACPSACLRKDPQTHMTVFDTTNCIGCHSCAMACPFGVPSFGSNGKMIKCDGCYVRIQNGMKPACVRACPTQALRLIDIDAPAEIPAEHSLRSVSMDMLDKQA